MSTPIDISEEAGVRYLHFGSTWVQGAMRIRRPYALELDYTREMMAALLLHDDADWPRRALLVGLGAGSLLKFIHRHLPQTAITVVEIEPAVVVAARQYFRVPEDDTRLRTCIADAAEFVAATKRRFDLILVDGFDRHARAGVLDTPSFYAACRSRLGDAGLLSVNLLGRSRGYKASLARIAAAFDERALAFPSCDSGNVVAFAASGHAVDCTLADLRERARVLRDGTGLDLRPTISRLQLTKSLPGGRLVL